MSNYTVIPAHGRDYKTAKAAKQDWIDGKDFQIATHIRDPNDGRYCSIRDGFEVTIRFNKKQYTTKGVKKEE